MATHVSTGFASAILGPSAFDTLYRDSVIEVRAGPQPPSADHAPAGLLLALITRNGGPFAHGSPTNGLRWVRSGRYAYKDPSHRWVLRGVAAGQAGWWRLLRNAGDSGQVSTTDVRIDGAVGLDGAPDVQLFLESLAITPSTQIELPNFFFAIPPIT